MPGYANWKTLYKDEYFQLFEEGYPVGSMPEPDLSAEYLPFPAEVRGELIEDSISEEEWEKAYWNLWKVRQNGLRSDFSYCEPDDYDEIIRLSAPEPQLDPLNPAEYAERIKGAWFGRCAGESTTPRCAASCVTRRISDWTRSTISSANAPNTASVCGK